MERRARSLEAVNAVSTLGHKLEEGERGFHTSRGFYPLLCPASCPPCPPLLWGEPREGLVPGTSVGGDKRGRPGGRRRWRGLGTNHCHSERSLCTRCFPWV